MKFAPLSVLVLLALTAGAQAQCPADALGTARVLTVDPVAMPRVGRKHFPQTLPLRPKELVLTFDDGPEAGPTERVLAALKRECVKASLFLLGRNAEKYPPLARQGLREGPPGRTTRLRTRFSTG